MAIRHNLIIFAVLAVLASTAVFYWQVQGSASIIPAGVKSQARFPLYEPRELPKGFSLDSSSLQYTGGVLSFKVKKAKNSYFITQQIKPLAFDIKNFHLTQINKPQLVSTYGGIAVMGQFGGNRVSSLAASQTWVMITAPATAPEAQLKLLTEQLSPAK